VASKESGRSCWKGCAIRGWPDRECRSTPLGDDPRGAPPESGYHASRTHGRSCVNDLEWMELHLRCLFQHDGNGRTVRTRQPNGWPSPLFVLGRTPLGNLWRFRDDLEPAVVRELARLVGMEAPLQEGHPPPERIEAIRSVLRSAVELVVEWSGPVFRFPEEIRLAEPDVLPVVAVKGKSEEGALGTPDGERPPA